MSLRAYFENVKGVGVLATADAEGKANTAIYARPRFLDPDDESSVAFIMNERLSYANVRANPHASYLFIEEGDGYIGKRLALTKTREEDDAEKIKALRRRNLPDECYEGKPQHLVYFRIEGVRPLVGTEK